VAGPTRHHPLTKQPGKDDRSPQVNGENAVKLLDGVVGQLTGPRNPSVGDENVNVSTQISKPLKISVLSKISDNGPPLNLSGKGFKDVPTPPGERQLTPLSPQPPRDRLPKPTRSPGNKNRPTTKFHGGMVIATPDKIARTPASPTSMSIEDADTPSRSDERRTLTDRPCAFFASAPGSGDGLTTCCARALAAK
jgi:hypothetical protein